MDKRIIFGWTDLGIGSELVELKILEFGRREAMPSMSVLGAMMSSN